MLPLWRPVHLEGAQISEKPCKVAADQVDVSEKNKQCLRDRFPEGKFHVEGCSCYSLEPLFMARDANCHDQTQHSGHLTCLEEETNVTELFEFQFESAVSVRFATATNYRQHGA